MAENPFVAVQERQKLLAGHIFDIWPDAAGDAADHSAAGNDGTLVNTPTIEAVQGRRYTYKFTAADTDYIDLSSHVAEVATLEEWTINIRYMRATSADECLFSISDNTGLNSLWIGSQTGTSSLRVRMRVNNSTVYDARTNSSTTPNVGSQAMTPMDGRMHDVTISYSVANGLRWYIDGIIAASLTTTAGTLATDCSLDRLLNVNSMYISRGKFATTNFYSGANISRVQMFDHDLDDTERQIARYLGMMVVGMGQSNWTGYENDDGDAVLNASNPEIHDMVQTGDGDNYKWEVLTEPINGSGVPAGSLSMVMPLAKLMLPYVKAIDPFGEVYMPTVAAPGTGFVNNHWNDGDATFINAERRINYAIRQGIVVAFVVWQGGEQETYLEASADAQPAAFRAFHTAICGDIAADQIGTLDEKVWLLGAMTPGYIDDTAFTLQVDAQTQALADEYLFMKYTSSAGLVSNNIHYTAAAIRSMSERHWDNFLSLVDPDPTSGGASSDLARHSLPRYSLPSAS